MPHPEIRHCYVVIPNDGEWLAVGKSTEGIEVMIVENIKDVVEDDILIKSEIRRPKRGLFMLNPGVGYTKQVLGINKPFIWTPYQLFKYLEKQNGR